MCAPGKQILLFSPDKKLDLLDGIFGSEFSVAIHRKLPDSAQIEQNFQINSNLILIAGEGAQADSVTVFLDECEKKGRNVVFILALISPSSVHNSSWQSLADRTQATLVLTHTNEELSRALHTALMTKAEDPNQDPSSGDFNDELDETIALLENYQSSPKSSRPDGSKEQDSTNVGLQRKRQSSDGKGSQSEGEGQLFDVENLSTQNLIEQNYASPEAHLESLIAELDSLESTFEGLDLNSGIVEDVKIATVNQRKENESKKNNLDPEQRKPGAFDGDTDLLDPIESRLKKLDEGSLERDDSEDLPGDFGKEVSKSIDKSKAGSSKVQEVYPEKRRSDDPYIKIVVSSNLLEARLILYPHESEHHGIEEIKAELERQGIIYGIDSSKIEKCLRLANERREPVLGDAIALGKAPVEGQDARVEYEFELDPILHLEEDGDGRIDYRNVYRLACVDAGDCLATVHPPVQPQDGTSVFGEVIAGKTGKESRIVAARNVRYEESENKFYAEISGQPCLKGIKLTVLPVYTVPHDVDYSTGNIDFLGSVVVSTNVTSGFRVRASEDILVMGVVEAAELHAGGEIFIKRGFMGAGKGKLKAKKRIILKYASSGNIVSDSDLLVEDSLLNCDVTSRGKVRVVTGKGSIIGGITRGVNGIECINSGTEIGTPTQLIVGEHFLIRQMLNELNHSLSQKKTFLKKLRNGIQALSVIENTGIVAKTSQLKANVSAIEEQLKTLQGKKDALLENFKKKCLSRILVRSFAYPGVRIFTGSANMNIVDKAVYCSFHEDPDRVAVKLAPFERREIEKKK